MEIAVDTVQAETRFCRFEHHQGSVSRSLPLRFLASFSGDRQCGGSRFLLGRLQALGCQLAYENVDYDILLRPHS
jgi:hypothetical protein